jgi:hypothetical protein
MKQRVREVRANYPHSYVFVYRGGIGEADGQCPYRCSGNVRYIAGRGVGGLSVAPKPVTRRDGGAGTVTPLPDFTAHQDKSTTSAPAAQ